MDGGVNEMKMGGETGHAESSADGCTNGNGRGH